MTVINEPRAQTHGLEIFAKFTPVRRWTLSTGITELRGASPPSTGYPAVADNPLHEVNAQSKLDVTHFLNFDDAYYYNDAIHNQLPPLNRVDVGFSTKPIHGFSFSTWGRNLQQARHTEAIPTAYLSGEIRRSVVFKAIWEPGEGAKKTTTQ